MEKQVDWIALSASDQFWRMDPRRGTGGLSSMSHLPYYLLAPMENYHRISISHQNGSELIRNLGLIPD